MLKRKRRKPRKSIKQDKTTGHHGLDRLMLIHQLLQAGKEPTVKELSEQLGYSRKTIVRSINYLRDERGYPISFDRKTNRYRYTADVVALPDVTVTEQQLFALFVATKTLTDFKGHPLHGHLTEIFKKLTQGLRGSVSFSLSGMENALSMKASGVAMANPDRFFPINQAITQGEELLIHYHKLADEEPMARIIQPWRLAFINNQWYLFAHDNLRQELRCFVLSRISHLEKNGTFFQPQRNFDLEAHLCDSFGVYKGKESHDIHLRFTSTAARLVGERQWHPRQRLVPLPGGELEFHLHLNNLNEILHWVLYWGEQCTVLGPEALVQQVREQSAGMLRKYGGEGGRQSSQSTVVSRQ
ncbi:MAG: transcriptional regulator [Verrucomicrobiota bacterium]|nr:transcriptional regulator [Verrucomicrobiota bacterium]